ncbi:hypothetical protein [Gordonia sp. N1V]|uniref:hypothetical protein n=1 Tax=Gordonia sp. N1V TaxID=3034163 RepID=UPI0023E097A6|nr:hypothetical protein [Gordonia sp. N1V]MDF3280468.1 hypothetical protein [Gordonia sp. N1V]
MSMMGNFFGVEIELDLQKAAENGEPVLTRADSRQWWAEQPQRISERLEGGTK